MFVVNEVIYNFIEYLRFENNEWYMFVDLL